jgi:hypothetical protein
MTRDDSYWNSKSSLGNKTSKHTAVPVLWTARQTCLYDCVYDIMHKNKHMCEAMGDARKARRVDRSSGQAAYLCF